MDIAKEFKVSERHSGANHPRAIRGKGKEMLHYPAPLVIGIDEHKIHKRRFATTIVDLKESPSI